MRILSLDLSTKSSGFAVFDDGELLEYGTIKSNDTSYLVRNKIMADKVRVLLDTYGGFDHVVIEELKIITNQRTLVVLGILHGMVIRECQDTHTILVPPTVWRKPFNLNYKRNVAKKKAISLCRTKYKIPVKNDDEAEAILLGKYFGNKVDGWL